MTTDPAGEEILRAKYLDWCSARIADRFLELSPDQVYELAHHRPSPTEDESDLAPLADTNTLYLDLVERAATTLAETLELPAFEEWVEAYLQSPESYDPDLMGLWKLHINESRGQ